MYEKKTLSNGVRIVSQQVPSVRSAAVGIWVLNGSRHEPLESAGISHFIEHMIFKGTAARSAQEIAIEMDAIGGQVNAFTTKECTCFYLKTLDTHLAKGITILADMFLNSKYDDSDLNLERGVILEEIGMYEDSPEDVASEKLFEACFDGSALGRPILGTQESLSKMNGTSLRNYVAQCYRPEDTLISLAGSFSQKDIDLISSLFQGMQGEGRNRIEPAEYHTAVVVKPKEIEQNHLCIGFPGSSMVSEDRYALQLFKSILGGGMSSRLFQSVREKNGLCYSIYTFHTAHEDTGLFNIYTALNPAMEKRAIELVREICQEFCENGPTEEELDHCREQVKTNILLGLESTSARMHRLAKGELFHGYVVEMDELIERYDSVNRQELICLARKILDFQNASICAVGTIQDKEFYKRLLNS